MNELHNFRGCKHSTTETMALDTACRKSLWSQSLTPKVSPLLMWKQIRFCMLQGKLMGKVFSFSRMINDDTEAHLEEHRETLNETRRPHEILYR